MGDHNSLGQRLSSDPCKALANDALVNPVEKQVIKAVPQSQKGMTLDRKNNMKHERLALQHKRAHWEHAIGGAAPLWHEHLLSQLRTSEALSPMKLETVQERWANS